MHEAIIKLFFLSRGSVLSFLYSACSDIHTTKYSGGHENLVKIIKKWWLATFPFLNGVKPEGIRNELHHPKLNYMDLAGLHASGISQASATSLLSTPC